MTVEVYQIISKPKDTLADTRVRYKTNSKGQDYLDRSHSKTWGQYVLEPMPSAGLTEYISASITKTKDGNRLPTVLLSRSIRLEEILTAITTTLDNKEDLINVYLLCEGDTVKELIGISATKAGYDGSLFIVKTLGIENDPSPYNYLVINPTPDDDTKIFADIYSYDEAVDLKKQGKLPEDIVL